MMLLKILISGSPPRMREIQVLVAMKWALLGITPAYAGNTGDYDPPLRISEDHPRVCGKYPSLHLMHSAGMGSPPRMREILVFFQIAFNKCRITPAYAGNTWRCCTGWSHGGDHPRVCGKYSASCGMIAPHAGSPPRMREIHSMATSRAIRYRITPAYAGNT